ncbi:MAG: hypothetical protein WA426_20535, partial [Silvibacterium sp.]
RGKTMVVLDITTPQKIQLKAEVALDSPAPFDFVQRIGIHAVLVRFRDGSGFEILDLSRPKEPVLKGIEAPASETYIEPTSIRGNTHSSSYRAADIQDYQIVDRKNSVVLATVKQVQQQLNDFASGATYLLGQDGLTVVRNPRIESFILPCHFYDSVE